MGNVILDSRESQTYYQPSTNISNQIYKTHLLVSINKEDNSMQKNEANNKNDDITAYLRYAIKILGALEEK